jgi:hypothetical protein
MNATPRESSPVDRDGVNGGVVLLATLATLLVMGLGVAVAHELLTWGVGAEDPREARARFGRPPADMNAIEMSLFASRALASPRETPSEDAERDPAAANGLPRAASANGAAPPALAADRQAAARGAARRLQSYGWSDRERRTVHIPISRAVELYLAREQLEPVAPGERREGVAPGEKQEPAPRGAPDEERKPAPGGAPRGTP